MPKGGVSNPISISKLVPSSHWCGWKRFIKDIESKRKEAMQCNAMLRLGEGYYKQKQIGSEPVVKHKHRHMSHE